MGNLPAPLSWTVSQAKRLAPIAVAAACALAAVAGIAYAMGRWA